MAMGTICNFLRWLGAAARLLMAFDRAFYFTEFRTKLLFSSLLLILTGNNPYKAEERGDDLTKFQFLGGTSTGERREKNLLEFVRPAKYGVK